MTINDFKAAAIFTLTSKGNPTIYIVRHDDGSHSAAAKKGGRGPVDGGCPESIVADALRLFGNTAARYNGKAADNSMKVANGPWGV